jgi:hypothetical protein
MVPPTTKTAPAPSRVIVSKAPSSSLGLVTSRGCNWVYPPDTQGPYRNSVETYRDDDLAAIAEHAPGGQRSRWHIGLGLDVGDLNDAPIAYRTGKEGVRIKRPRVRFRKNLEERGSEVVMRGDRAPSQRWGPLC